MGLWEKAGSKKEEVVLLWDGCIHFMEILPRCALVSAVGGVGVYNAGEVGTYGAGSGVFRRLRRRASFWMPRKKPKRHRGEPQVELRPFGLVLHAVSPLDPLFYGGRQLGGMAGRRKGAGGVGIDVASPTAAAAWVGFPVRRFPRLRARLWHSGAQVPRWGGAGGDLHHPGALAAPQEAREGNPTLFRCPPYQGPVARRELGLSTQGSTRRNVSIHE